MTRTLMELAAVIDNSAPWTDPVLHRSEWERVADVLRVHAQMVEVLQSIEELGGEPTIRQMMNLGLRTRAALEKACAS